MLTLTGQIYRKPGIFTTKSGKQVVHFTILDRFQFIAPNGELKEITNYYNCSYWKSESLATILKKGMTVSVSGYNRAEYFKNDQGEHKAHNAFHVELFSFNPKSLDQDQERKAKKKEHRLAKADDELVKTPAGKPDIEDEDLPF